MPYKSLFGAKGFTLVELVMGILVFAVAMTMLLSLLFPQVKNTIEPIYQIRAVKLANTLLNEIQAKAYDENSNPSLGLFRCGEASISCTDAAKLGPDRFQPAGPFLGDENRDQFDDVDDFDKFNIDATMLAATTVYKDLYINYSLTVSVVYDGNYDGVADNNQRAKLITVDVTTPSGEVISFASYRSNF